MKGSTATRCPLLSSQINGLSEYQRRASQLLYRALPPQRQRGRQETARAWRQWVAAISTPDTMSSTKLWAGSHLLICLPGILNGWQLPGLSQPEISIPDETHSTPGTVLSWCTWEPEWWGPGIWVRCTAHMGECACQTLVPWAVRTREGHRMHSQPRPVPWQSSQEPERLRSGKCMKCSAAWDRAVAEHPGDQAVYTRDMYATLDCGKPSVVRPLSVLPIHASGICLHAPRYPQHSWTSESILNKWPHLPLCVRVKIRHWSDLQTQEAKTNKEGGTATY